MCLVFRRLGIKGGWSGLNLGHCMNVGQHARQAGSVAEKISPGNFTVLRWLRVAAVAGFMSSAAVDDDAQTTLLSEGFEGAFPGVWSVSDPGAPAVYWKDVYTAFGTVPAHTGSWKGYCAGIGYGGTSSNPTYTNNMTDAMSRTVNLSGYTGANLSFWYDIPSIETCCDHFRVYMDATLLFDTHTNTAGWQFLALPLNAYLGGSHTLKFEFDSDVSVFYEGAYLDDIRVSAANQPVTTSLQSLANANYTGYVLDSDAALGRSNIQAQAVWNAENFTGASATYTNVLAFRLINTNGNTPQPIYDWGNTATNTDYTYNITNVLLLAAGTNVTVTNTAYIRPAAWMSQFTQFYLECRLFTNGVLAQTLTTVPTNYYHFTNTVSGDTAYNVLLNLTNNSWSRTYAVQTIPGQNTFQVNVGYQIRRWDDFNAAISSANIPVVFNYTLRDAGGNVVPLANTSQTFYDSVANYTLIFFKTPTALDGAHVLDIQPAGQLDSVNKTYYLTVTLSHTNNPFSGQVLTANTLVTGTDELLHFNGNLYFGALATIITGLGAAPPVNPPGGGVIPTSLGPVSGYLAGKAGFTFSTAASLGVNLQPNGDAILTAGSVTLNPPASPDLDSIAGVKFQRGPITLSTSGANADLTVTLPTGFGYRLNDTTNLVVSAFLPFSGVPLTQTLTPAGDLAFLPGARVYAVEEDKPAWLVSDRILWHVSLGTFDVPATGIGEKYVRADEFAYLQSVSNLLVDPPNMGDKRSNEKYWLSLNALVGTATVRPDVQGNSLLTATFNFGAGAFRAHFPYDTVVQWSGAGSMKVTDDLVAVGASSVLNGATTVTVPYTRNCVDCGSSSYPPGTPTLSAASGLFYFTTDGGLIASGATTSTVDLQWGYIGSPVFDFAQQALGFTSAVFHMPGAFLRGDQNLLPPVQGATTILFTGVAASNLNYLERPLSAGYTAGLADYAGMNFRCLADNAHTARSTIAGQTGINWSLTGRSKYYVRYGGVTGIHEAVPGSFPATLTLWGYQFNFSNYGLSYLDSRNDQPPATSLVNGLITLPYPANFAQAFNHMTFSCLGAPEAGEVPPGDGFKLMAYWLADFKTHSITFKSNNGCSPTSGFLVLGIEGYASHVNKPLYGEIGFFPGGDQIPAAFGLSNVVSRLKLPNLITLDGPTNTSYTFTPAQDGYYNTWSNRDAASSAPGWMNLFGKMDVPFFEDLQLHLETGCHTNGAAASNAVVYLSGGWPRVGSSDPNHGWEISGRTPFETNIFDTVNAGWTSAAGSIEKYHDNTGEDYHPRAQRLWLGVVDFDYPLSWNFSLRTFKSWQPVTNDLLIVKIEHQVTYLDPLHCSLDFGAQYSGLPKISIANLAFNAIDQATGVGDAIVKSATKPIEDALSTGLDEMDQLLNTQMKQLMDGVFDRTVDPVIDAFYNDLSNQWANTWNSLSLAQRQQFIQGVYNSGLNYFVGNGGNPVSSNLTAVLTQLGSGVNSASDLIGQIQKYLRDGTNAIESIIGVVSIGTNGQNLGSNVVGLITKQLDGSRDGVGKLASSLIGELAPQFIDATIGPTLSNLVAQAEPAFSQISQSLGQVEAAMIQVNTQLNAAGQFTAELSNILAGATLALSSATMQVTLATTQYFGNLNLNIDNPFQAVSAGDVKKFIRQRVEDQFFASVPAVQIQTALRQRLYDLDALMEQQIDSVFQQVNGMMRDLISQSLAQIDNSINSCLGSVSDVMGAGSLQGHADIVGDSLKLLRIDGHFQFKVPDNMELDAFLEIKELNSDGSGNGCGDINAPFTEVTLGADKVPLNWISSGLTADVEAKFTFDGVVPFPIDLGGQMALNGDVNFQTFDLHDLAVAMAFGATENYIALKGGVRFNGFDFSGAAFFGRTCTLDPLKLIDPDVASVLGNPPFTGGYVYAQGWLPVSQLVTGIPATCLFEISAGVGAGAFYFAEGPTFGGKMFLGVSGQLLCIVSIEGDVTLIGVDHGGNVQFLGKGHFEASLGPCPFCISVSKDVSIAYLNNSWSIQ